MYSLKALQRVVEMGDHIITWEKGYTRDGWGEAKESESFIRLRPRNPNGNEIEVAILASDQEQSAREIIIEIFSRWLQ